MHYGHRRGAKVGQIQAFFAHQERSKEGAKEVAKEAAKEAGQKLYKTLPFKGIKAQATQKEASFIEHAKKGGPLTAEIYQKRSVNR